MEQQSIRVNLPDGRVVNFPSTMSEADIGAALSSITNEGPQPEQKSVGGFLGNVLESGKNFVVDTVKGLPSLGRGAIRTVGNVARTMSGDPRGILQSTDDAMRVGSALGQHAKERYGSLEKAGETLYRDPVGALADLSTVAGGGAALPGKAGRISTRISTATNPARALKPIATATEVGAAALVRPSLNPPKRIRGQQRAPLEIERTAIRGRVLTSKQAGKRAGTAAAESTQKAQAATAQGVTVPKQRVAQFQETLKEVEAKTPNIKPLDDLANLESEVNATLPANITPSELLERRRSLDSDLNKVFRAAEQPGGPIPGVRESGQQELVTRMRDSLRETVPDIRASDDAARRFGMAADAFSDTEIRPSRLITGFTGGGILGALMSGNVPGAIASGAFGAALQYPQIPLALGIPPAAVTRLMATDPAMRAAILARLAGQEPE